MNKHIVARMVLYYVTPLSQHTSVFNYSLISSHQVERGFESIWREEGGSLFTLVVIRCFLSFCDGAELVYGDLILETKEAAGQTEAHPAQSVYVSPASCEHTYRHILYNTNTSSHSGTLSPSDGRLLSPSFYSWGIFYEQREAGLFLIGMSSPGDPLSWLYSA